MLCNTIKHHEANVARIESIRILIVDDSAYFRTMIWEILSQQPGIDIIGEAADGKEAIDSVMVLNPSVVVMDIQMPVLDGIEAARCISTFLHPPQILIMSGREEPDCVKRAFQAGASGFIWKHSLAKTLLPSVLSVGQRPAPTPPRAS